MRHVGLGYGGALGAIRAIIATEVGGFVTDMLHVDKWGSDPFFA